MLHFKDPQDVLLHRILKFMGEQQSVSIYREPALTLDFSGLKIQMEERRVLVEGIEVGLTGKEFDLLVYLTSHPGRVFTKEQIYHRLYEGANLEEIDNIIYCLIRGLRKKLEADPRQPKYIHTVRGVGYKFKQFSEE